MSEVFYRKFRPNNFTKMVGQQSAVTILSQSVKKSRIHHAYLFAGGSGCGKTTAARIFAMAINCTERKAGDCNPCGKCESCVSITENMSIDVMELNSATEGGKDAAKMVIESSLYNPTKLKYRVFIVDEAQELTSGAIAALLKPTEEPGKHVVFILCTSEYHKISPTLASRFIRIFFPPISDETISDYLLKLSKHINASADPDACREIAAVSGGNMRVALNYLESMLLTSDNKLTTERARELIGLAGRNDLYAVAKHIAASNAGAALDVTDSLASTAMDVGLLCAELASIFRNAMLSAAGATKGFSLSSAEKELVDGLAKEIGLKRLLDFTRKFTEAHYALSIKQNKRWVLETLVASLCQKKT